mmetsp:Transcript_11400/g.49141  ORF Transcript_11400/g.49141 Transcript_11400/m.49141 type:complete len:309 (-) Transcript_11400:49-975(-)
MFRADVRDRPGDLTHRRHPRVHQPTPIQRIFLSCRIPRVRTPAPRLVRHDVWMFHEHCAKRPVRLGRLAVVDQVVADVHPRVRVAAVVPHLPRHLTRELEGKSRGFPSVVAVHHHLVHHRVCGDLEIEKVAETRARRAAQSVGDGTHARVRVRRAQLFEHGDDAVEEVLASGDAAGRDPSDVVPSRDDADGVGLRDAQLDRRAETPGDSQRREGERDVTLAELHRALLAFFPYRLHVLVDPRAVRKPRYPLLAKVHERLVRSHDDRGGGPQRVVQVERDDLHLGSPGRRRRGGGEGTAGGAASRETRR